MQAVVMLAWVIWTFQKGPHPLGMLLPFQPSFSLPSLVSKSALMFSLLEDRSLGETSSFAPRRAVVEEMNRGVSCGWECQKGAPLWRQKSQNPRFPSPESRDALWDGILGLLFNRAG